MKVANEMMFCVAEPSVRLLRNNLEHLGVGENRVVVVIDDADGDNVLGGVDLVGAQPGKDIAFRASGGSVIGAKGLSNSDEIKRAVGPLLNVLANSENLNLHNL